MDATIYVSPVGVTQEVVSPEAAVRLGAGGWWPREQLEAAAEYNPHAKGVLEAMKVRQAELKARQNARAAAQTGQAAAAEQPPAQPPEQVAEQMADTGGDGARPATSTRRKG